MIRRPPRSTLFPYTPSPDLSRGRHSLPCRRTPARRAHCPRPSSGRRSEEHTSELQSRSDLVCRLLLEKKKTATDLLRRDTPFALDPPLRPFMISRAVDGMTR